MISVEQVLSAANITPVLFDVGASGAPPAVWNSIAPRSVYIGFDPDARDLHQPSSTPYRRAVIVNKAVSAQADAAEVRFFLTESPYCSSTLEPDAASLSNYLFAPLFRVLNEGRAPAITLDQVIEQVGVSGIDWLKLDTQGTDLRIFTSLNDAHRANVIAVDAEPGLIDAYRGEDLFIDLHRRMSAEGFWLSRLDVKHTVRMQRDTLDHIPGMSSERDRALLMHDLPTSPGWCEARYLRRIDRLPAGDSRAFLLLWTFALLDDQLGFAWDVLTAYERMIGADDTARLMRTCLQHETDNRLKRLRRIERLKSLVRPVYRRLRQ